MQGSLGSLPPSLPGLGLGKVASISKWTGASPARSQAAPCRKQLEREHRYKQSSWASPAQGMKSHAGDVSLPLGHTGNTKAGTPAEEK